MQRRVTCGTNSEPNQFNWTLCQSASLKGHNQFQEVGSIEAGSAGISDGHFSLGKERKLHAAVFPKAQHTESITLLG